MGRRVLNSPSREIVLVPFFNGQTPNVAGLSNESYLRLTAKGVALAKACPKTTRLAATPTTKALSRNMHLTNLPTSTTVNEIVEYIERTYDVVIQRALTSQSSPHSDCTSCHLEFETTIDFDTVTAVTQKHGFNFHGRAVLLRLDRRIPLWDKSDPTSLYERTKKNELTRESTDTSDWAESMDNGSNSPTETEAADLITDEKNLETIESTDLLYGDNLSLLYAPGAQKQVGNALDCDGAAQSFHGVDETGEENIGLSFEIPVDNSLFLDSGMEDQTKEMDQETITLTAPPTFTGDNAGGVTADQKTEELVDEIGAMAASLDLLLS